jgi:hypothetical protein
MAHIERHRHAQLSRAYTNPLLPRALTFLAFFLFASSMLAQDQEELLRRKRVPLSPSAVEKIRRAPSVHEQMGAFWTTEPGWRTRLPLVSTGQGHRTDKSDDHFTTR